MKRLRVAVRYEVPAANDQPAGLYRSINGNQALALGLVTVAQKMNHELVFAGYPITPASTFAEPCGHARHGRENRADGR